MTDASLIDPTVIHEPPPTADETEMLLFALDRSRAQFAWKAGGLDDAALHRTVASSRMTLAGMIKHLALMEDLTTTEWLTGRMDGPWRREHFDADPEWDWHTALHDSADDLYELWSAAVGRARAAWREALADRGLDGPAALVEVDGQPANLRRGLVDLHDEYARHVGHADLFREAIDGLVGEDPPQPE
ncbi:MAG TPA: DUF664 domain-containing protein [Microlunatus sp.]|nr:DUF664 domain-containing protein [Microlunatus sp.]